MKRVVTRTFWRRWGTLMAYSFFTLAIVAGFFRLETYIRDNRNALCKFVVDLDRRREAQRQYRDNVLAGKVVLVPGLTIADLQKSIDAQAATLRSFEALDCIDHELDNGG